MSVLLESVASRDAPEARRRRHLPTAADRGWRRGVEGRASVRVMEVDEKSWETEVIRRSEETPVVVDFWAEWCKPCKQLTPVLEEAVEGRDVVLATVDVDANKNLAREYDIAGIPAVKAFKHGRVVAEFVGAKSRVAVDAFLDELTKPPVADELDDEEVAAGAASVATTSARSRSCSRAAEDPDRREEARRVMVELFGELGQDHPLSIAVPAPPRGAALLSRRTYTVPVRRAASGRESRGDDVPLGLRPGRGRRSRRARSPTAIRLGPRRRSIARGPDRSGIDARPAPRGREPPCR